MSQPAVNQDLPDANLGEVNQLVQGVEALLLDERNEAEPNQAVDNVEGNLDEVNAEPNVAEGNAEPIPEVPILDNLGEMSEQCKNCGAQFFKDEVIGKELNDIDFCCKSGSITMKNPFAENGEHGLDSHCIYWKNNAIAFANIENNPIRVIEGYKYPGGEVPINLKCYGTVRHVAVSPQSYTVPGDCMDVKAYISKDNLIASYYHHPSCESGDVNPVRILHGLYNVTDENTACDSKDLCISNTCPLIDPMVYPIYFPNGTLGWSSDFKSNGHPVSQSEYYRYLAMVRESYNALHDNSVLTRKFFMDVWARIDQQSLRNQHQTHQGPYRNLNDEHLDTIALFEKYGDPHWFITFTCNPRWAEITGKLVEGQNIHDRPDLIARVFKLKVDRMMKHLLEKDLLGKVKAYALSYEWQERGLPHIHLLLTMEVKPSTEDIARLSWDFEPKDDAALAKTVAQQMKERKKEEKEKKGSPEKKSPKKKSPPIYTVAAYNPDLLRIFDAHINFKQCDKNIIKYLYKGSNEKAYEEWKMRKNEKEFNEIDHYLKNRSFCAPEACHRLFQFPIFQRSH